VPASSPTRASNIAEKVSNAAIMRPRHRSASHLGSSCFCGRYASRDVAKFSEHSQSDCNASNRCCCCCCCCCCWCVCRVLLSKVTVLLLCAYSSAPMPDLPHSAHLLVTMAVDKYDAQQSLHQGRACDSSPPAKRAAAACCPHYHSAAIPTSRCASISVHDSRRIDVQPVSLFCLNQF
jgi:hypothetical protein